MVIVRCLNILSMIGKYKGCEINWPNISIGRASLAQLFKIKLD